MSDVYLTFSAPFFAESIVTPVKKKTNAPEWADNELPKVTLKGRFNSKARLKRETVLVTLRASGGKDPVLARGVMHMALATARVVYDDVFCRWLAHFPVLVDLQSDSSFIGTVKGVCQVYWQERVVKPGQRSILGVGENASASEVADAKAPLAALLGAVASSIPGSGSASGSVAPAAKEKPAASSQLQVVVESTQEQSINESEEDKASEPPSAALVGTSAPGTRRGSALTVTASSAGQTDSGAPQVDVLPVDEKGSPLLKNRHTRSRSIVGRIAASAAAYQNDGQPESRSRGNSRSRRVSNDLPPPPPNYAPPGAGVTRVTPLTVVTVGSGGSKPLRIDANQNTHTRHLTAFVDDDPPPPPPIEEYPIMAESIRPTGRTPGILSGSMNASHLALDLGAVLSSLATIRLQTSRPLSKPTTTSSLRSRAGAAGVGTPLPHPSSLAAWDTTFTTNLRNNSLASDPVELGNPRSSSDQRLFSAEQIRKLSPPKPSPKHMQNRANAGASDAQPLSPSRQTSTTRSTSPARSAATRSVSPSRTAAGASGRSVSPGRAVSPGPSEPSRSYAQIHGKASKSPVSVVPVGEAPPKLGIGAAAISSPPPGLTVIPMSRGTVLRTPQSAGAVSTSTQASSSAGPARSADVGRAISELKATFGNWHAADTALGHTLNIGRDVPPPPKSPPPPATGSASGAGNYRPKAQSAADSFSSSTAASAASRLAQHRGSNIGAVIAPLSSGVPLAVPGAPAPPSEVTSPGGHKSNGSVSDIRSKFEAAQKR